MLLHLPRGYEDRRVITSIAGLCEGECVTICGTVKGSRAIRLRGRQSIAELTVEDGTGEARATFFGRGFLARTFPEGARVVLSGLVAQWKGLALKNPDYEIVDGEDGEALGRIVPVYPLTDGISQRMMRSWIGSALELLPPEDATERDGGLGSLGAALRTLHRPAELEDVEPARRRAAYEELLDMQCRIMRRRILRSRILRSGVASDEGKGWGHVTDGELLRRLCAALPFSLTAGQRGAVADILGDMSATRPMRRLLQGDVGCGKTAVALHAIAAASDGGFQSAFMAPTELLAEQHYRSLRSWLDPLGIESALLTSATSCGELCRRIADGEVRVITGTHALFQDAVEFARLGLVIIDEQHRFGVEQRARLTRKGAAADVLHMTATPIPRSLALTAYGACDISLIGDMPAGRMPVKTSRIPPEKEADLYRFICDRAADGHQAYFVCPLIDESETKTVSALTARYDALSSGALECLRTAYLHGRMSAAEKDGAMQAFAAGDIDVLFATSVIEVGIDVARATAIVLDDAAHFGLTQLHQLRGRVGRGAEQSYCFLLGTPKTEDGALRLQTLIECASGFDIAEADLAQRGPGEVYGARQSGLSDLRAARMPRDTDLLESAREAARALVESSIDGDETLAAANDA